MSIKDMTDATQMKSGKKKKKTKPKPMSIDSFLKDIEPTKPEENCEEKHEFSMASSFSKFPASKKIVTEHMYEMNFPDVDSPSLYLNEYSQRCTSALEETTHPMAIHIISVLDPHSAKNLLFHMGRLMLMIKNQRQKDEFILNLRDECSQEQAILDDIRKQLSGETKLIRYTVVEAKKFCLCSAHEIRQMTNQINMVDLNNIKSQLDLAKFMALIVTHVLHESYLELDNEVDTLTRLEEKLRKARDIELAEQDKELAEQGKYNRLVAAYKQYFPNGGAFCKERRRVNCENGHGIILEYYRSKDLSQIDDEYIWAIAAHGEDMCIHLFCNEKMAPTDIKEKCKFISCMCRNCYMEPFDYCY